MACSRKTRPCFVQGNCMRNGRFYGIQNKVLRLCVVPVPRCSASDGWVYCPSRRCVYCFVLPNAAGLALLVVVGPSNVLSNPFSWLNALIRGIYAASHHQESWQHFGQLVGFLAVCSLTQVPPVTDWAISMISALIITDCSEDISGFSLSHQRSCWISFHSPNQSL